MPEAAAPQPPPAPAPEGRAERRSRLYGAIPLDAVEFVPEAAPAPEGRAERRSRLYGAIPLDAVEFVPEAAPAPEAATPAERAHARHGGVAADVEVPIVKSGMPEVTVVAPEVWDASVPPGGYVCSACGWPVESEPCPDHGAHAPEAATPQALAELGPLLADGLTGCRITVSVPAGGIVTGTPAYPAQLAEMLRDLVAPAHAALAASARDYAVKAATACNQRDEAQDERDALAAERDELRAALRNVARILARCDAQPGSPSPIEAVELIAAEVDAGQAARECPCECHGRTLDGLHGCCAENPVDMLAALRPQVAENDRLARELYAAREEAASLRGRLATLRDVADADKRFANRMDEENARLRIGDTELRARLDDLASQWEHGDKDKYPEECARELREALEGGTHG